MCLSAFLGCFPFAHVPTLTPNQYTYIYGTGRACLGPVCHDTRSRVFLVYFRGTFVFFIRSKIIFDDISGVRIV